ncbi:MAG: hypothetical protein IT494_05680 [Gammaproteobacteria bacterium]|nr:hypothetical protein [Gammaproteobacteria bacterium]
MIERHIGGSFVARGLYLLLSLQFGFAHGAHADFTVTGSVVDGNGNPIAQAQVVYQPPPGSAGASAITVFADAQGEFAFPQAFSGTPGASLPLVSRALGYEYRTQARSGSNQSRPQVTLLMDRVVNQAAVAPASAWLRQRIPERQQQSQFVMDCIDCHQVPAPEVRDYAAAIADMHAPDPAVARTQSWQMIVQYMNRLSAWEFSRGSRKADTPPQPDAVYSVNNEDAVAARLADRFGDRLEAIEGYAWGAPLAVTPQTAIYEYAVPEPNAVREAVLLGGRALWVADVATNRMYEIDIASGRQKIHEAPVDVPIGPHSLHRAADGGLWVTPLFNNVLSRINPASGEWRTWMVRDERGRGAGIHDLSFGHDHELLTDASGRIWFSDIGNNGVGYLDPKTGRTELFAAPPVPGRENEPAMLYGLIMNKARNQIWYSQLGIGAIGGFDIDRQQFFEPIALPDPNSGPRRITIDDADVMYVALYGGGQLLEFDLNTRRIIGAHDLPDTASAPYTATWDPVRKVVWIGTANGDVIYRFDPKTKGFQVLPLPRTRAFLRMIDIDRATGVLVTSYANIVELVQGPRMAVIIDPGDNVYPQRFAPNGETRQ